MSGQQQQQQDHQSDAVATTPRGQFLSSPEPDQLSPHGTPPGTTPRELGLAGAKHAHAHAHAARRDSPARVLCLVLLPRPGAVYFLS